MEILIIIFCFVLILIGLAGIILPMLPGLVFIWLGIFIYAFKTGFQAISLTTVLIFLGITLLFLAVDFIAPLFGAKKYKASRFGITGAFLGAILGIFSLGPVGIIVGPFLGAFIGEIMSGRKRDQAFSSALGAMLGFLFGTLLKIIFGLVMFGFFIVSFF